MLNIPSAAKLFPFPCITRHMCRTTEEFPFSPVPGWAQQLCVLVNNLFLLFVTPLKDIKWVMTFLGIKPGYCLKCSDSWALWVPLDFNAKSTTVWKFPFLILQLRFITKFQQLEGHSYFRAYHSSELPPVLWYSAPSMKKLRNFGVPIEED